MSIQMQLAATQLLQGMQVKDPKLYTLFTTMLKELADLETQVAFLLASLNKVNTAAGTTVLSARQVMKRISLRA